jgi:hypothetical protein
LELLCRKSQPVWSNQSWAATENKYFWMRFQSIQAFSPAV